MIAELFAYGIAVALLVGLAAASVERVFAELRLPRRFAWLGAYCAALAVPLVAVAFAGGAPSPIGEPTAATNGAALVGTTRFDWDTPLLASWAIATSVLLAFYGIAWLRLRIAATRWLGAADGTGVLIAGDVGPAVLGVVRPRIVLPEWLLGAPAAVRSAVIVHEAEHIAARDPLCIVATQLVTILLPWNLPLWWFAKRLRAAVEIDCDERVLRAGVDPLAYSDVLLAVGQRRSVTLGAMVTLIEPVSQLERRIRIMLQRSTRLSKRRVASALALALCLAACTTQLHPPPLPSGAMAQAVPPPLERDAPPALERETAPTPAPTAPPTPAPTAPPTLAPLEPAAQREPRPVTRAEPAAPAREARPVERAREARPVRPAEPRAATPVTPATRATPVTPVTPATLQSPRLRITATSDRVVKTGDSVRLEGNVRLVADTLVISATRAIFGTAADGSAIVQLDDATVTGVE